MELGRQTPSVGDVAIDGPGAAGSHSLAGMPASATDTNRPVRAKLFGRRSMAEPFKNVKIIVSQSRSKQRSYVHIYGRNGELLFHGQNSSLKWAKEKAARAQVTFGHGATVGYVGNRK